MLTKEQVLSISMDFFKYSHFKTYFNYDELTTVYVSGSIMEGFGNKESDIDIFVIGNNDMMEFFLEYAKSKSEFTYYIKSDKLIITTIYSDTSIDMEFYNNEYVTEYIEKINNNQATYSDNRYDLIHRMKYGVPLINPEKFNKMLSTIEFNKYNLIQSQIVNDYYIVKSKDIKGAFVEDQYSTAYYMSLDLLVNCLSAYLAIYGETNPNNKWIFKKIERLEREQSNNTDLKTILFDAYSNVNLYDDKSTKNKILQILKSCQKLNSLIEKEKVNVY